VSEPLKVACIGVGGIVNTHMPGWQASPHTEVVAAADISAESLHRFAERWQVDRLTEDIDGLITDPAIDIVDICTPNRYHAPLAIRALEAGKHVLCEKPLAPTPAEIDEMIAARDRSGKLLMTAQHMRYGDNERALKREVETGALGEIYHSRAWMLRRAAVPTKPGFVLQEHSGGGPCIDIGVHVLDLTLWLMGNPEPVAVSGVARAEIAHRPGTFSVWGGEGMPAGFDVEEFAAGFVRFANGATMILEVSWLLHHDTRGEDRQVWLYGDRAGAHLPKMEIYETSTATKQLYNRALQYVPKGLEAHAAECVDFAEAVVEGRPSPVPPEQSRQVMTILDGLYRSQKESREVRLD